MHRIMIQSIVCAVLAFTSGFCFSQGYNLPPEPVLKGALQNASIQADSLTRNYDFYIPPALPDSVPLVMLFHGANSDPQWTRAQLNYKFETLADEYGFIVVYPIGIEKFWNDCIKDSQNPARMQNVDDVAFVEALIQRFQDEYRIDVKKVFAMGMSNGGFLCIRLAAEIPEKFRAIASILSILPAPDSNLCVSFDTPIPYMFMVGTEDPLTPYEGGFFELPGAFKANFLSAVETIHFFRDLAGYSSEPEQFIFPDVNPDDNSVVEEWSWRDGDKPEILFYIVHGGGHTWPIQYEDYQTPSFFGGLNRDDISTGELVWNFFQRQLEISSQVEAFSMYK